MENLIPVIQLCPRRKTFLQLCKKLFFQIALDFLGQVTAKKPAKEALGRWGWYVVLFTQCLIIKLCPEIGAKSRELPP